MRHTATITALALTLLTLLSSTTPTATLATYNVGGVGSSPTPASPSAPPTVRVLGADGSSPAASTTWQVQTYSPLSVPQGDGVQFQWSGTTGHSVVRLVNSTCPVSNSTILETLVPEAASGSYTFSTTPFAPGSTVYIACSVPTHCGLGMLLQIDVKASPASSMPRVAAASLAWAMAATAIAAVSAG